MFDIFRPISWVIRSNGHTTNLRGFNQICSFQPQTWEEDHQNHCILGTLYFLFFFLVMGVSFVFCISGVLAICHFWHLDGAALLSFAAHASGALLFTDTSQTPAAAHVSLRRFRCRCRNQYGNRSLGEAPEWSSGLPPNFSIRPR